MPSSWRRRVGVKWRKPWLQAISIQLDAKALNGADPGSIEYARLVQEIQDDARELLLVGAGYLLLAVVVGSAVRIVLLFAAVSTYSSSGEQQRTASFGALLEKDRAGLKGPLLTLAFVYVMEVVYVALLASMGALLGVLIVKQHLVALLLASLLFLAAAVCFVYFSFVCSLSFVVAVAEPGCHGAAALGRAWRLAKGKRRQVVLYVAVTGVLSPVLALARTCPGNSVALGLLLGFLYAVLMALVQLFAVCAMTAFYYERRDNSSDVGQMEVDPTAGYAKLSTEEATAA
ncbi:hypothetical protein ZWY2020_031541 [Hordeum vulgare]|nr:hypothetical protein ZWY2020_031541 [Hordeum vulgare]